LAVRTVRFRSPQSASVIAVMAMRGVGEAVQ
jgi:hypothetical protein